jgi:hypothetical protein
MNGYTYLAVSGQDTISLHASNNVLNVVGTNGVSVTTNATTNTLTFNTGNSIADLTVTNSLTINPAITGAMNNVIIGASTPKAGTFTSLTATSTVSFNPVNATITLSPTGTGTITIAPASVTGTINNVTIGNVTPADATFTSLTANGDVSMNGNNATINISPIGTGTIIVNPTVTGNINNIAIGSVTARAGRFSTLEMTTQPAGPNSAVTFGYAAALAAAYGMAMV